MKFSDRKGITAVPSVIQIESMNADLRISLWNVLYTELFGTEAYLNWDYSEPPRIYGFGERLFADFFKKPVDTLQRDSDMILGQIRGFFFSAQWYEVYNFIEFVVGLYPRNRALEIPLNAALEAELAGYRLVNGVVTDITSPQEVAMLQAALTDDRFAGVTAHLKTALEHMSRKKKPDYRNSIKESISAVEAMARIITGDARATLGDALKALEARKKIHGALKEGFSKLYGYTSDEGGIRHAMLEEPNITAADAKYFLLSCTSFVNYLKTQL